MGRNEEKGVRLFSVVPTDSTDQIKKQNQETPSEHRKTILYSESGQTLKVIQRYCGVPVCDVTQDFTGYGTRQPCVVYSV